MAEGWYGGWPTELARGGPVGSKGVSSDGAAELLIGQAGLGLGKFGEDGRRGGQARTEAPEVCFLTCGVGREVRLTDPPLSMYTSVRHSSCVHHGHADCPPESSRAPAYGVWGGWEGKVAGPPGLRLRTLRDQIDE